MVNNFWLNESNENAFMKCCAWTDELEISLRALLKQIGFQDKLRIILPVKSMKSFSHCSCERHFKIFLLSYDSFYDDYQNLFWNQIFALKNYHLSLRLFVANDGSSWKFLWILQIHAFIHQIFWFFFKIFLLIIISIFISVSPMSYKTLHVSHSRKWRHHFALE